jgi:hypothetical protein
MAAAWLRATLNDDPPSASAEVAASAATGAR